MNVEFALKPKSVDESRRYKLFAGQTEDKRDKIIAKMPEYISYLVKNYEENPSAATGMDDYTAMFDEDKFLRECCAHFGIELP